MPSSGEVPQSDPPNRAPSIVIVGPVKGAPHADWVHFLAHSLELDGHTVITNPVIPGEPMAPSFVVWVCTPQARAALEDRLRSLDPGSQSIVVLREGTPEAAIPPALSHHTPLDLRDAAPGRGELERLWCILAGQPPPEPRLTSAEVREHFEHLAEAEGVLVAGWSAVTWADDAHARDDFGAEWPLRRVAAELLRDGSELEDALVQARRGLTAALIADAEEGVHAHDQLIAELTG